MSTNSLCNQFKYTNENNLVGTTDPYLDGNYGTEILRRGKVLSVHRTYCIT